MDDLPKAADMGPPVRQMFRILYRRPSLPDIPFRLREFGHGGCGVSEWLEIQNAAFLAAGRRRPWSEADAQRELIARPWFRAENVWFAGTPSDGGHGVGSVALQLPRDAASNRQGARIHWLAVRPHWQRHGVGRLLVSTIERECWRHGIRRIELETLAKWRASVRFYESLGYRSVAEDGQAQGLTGCMHW